MKVSYFLAAIISTLGIVTVAWAEEPIPADLKPIQPVSTDKQHRNDEQGAADEIKAAINKKDYAKVKALVTSHRLSKEQLGQALVELIYSENISLMDFLLSNGADVNANGTYGATALHVAAGQGSLPVTEFLVRRGADLNAKNR